MQLDRPDARSLVDLVVASHFRDRPVAVLEAGGGARTRLDLDRLRPAGITTLDISAEQLARNTYADEKILGDLQEWRPERRWDLVVSFNVLEHVPRVDRALAGLVAACAEDGLIVVGGPVPRSFSGTVTRLTPHWFHVLVYRHALGDRHAGAPGRPPFPTHFHALSDPGRLTAFLEGEGFACRLLLRYEGGIYRNLRRRHPWLGWPVTAVTWALNALTPKRYDSRHSDFCAVFHRPLARPAPDGRGGGPAAARAPAPRRGRLRPHRP